MRYEESEDQAIEEISKWECWDKFLECRSNPGFRQSSWYASFKLSHNGWKNIGTVLKDGETIVGGAVVFRRTFGPDKCYYYMPDGPVLPESDPISDQKEAFDAILEFIESKRRDERRVVSHLCIIPRWERVPGFVTGFRESKHFYGLPRDTQCIDLDSSEDDILAQMKPKGRYNVRVARRHGVSVLEDVSSQGIAHFLNIYEETFARKNLRAKDPDYFHTLISMLSASGRGSLFSAEYQGTRLATALVVFFADTATYYYGGSRAIHRNVMAPYLLHFEIMRKAKALGCRYYDLFGVSPSSAPDGGWKDFSVFKRKLGGRELRLAPTLEYVYDPVAYEEWEARERDRRKDRHGRSSAQDQANSVGG
jgi:peptidoglycan pentaglycine glycine transferase (the first glycine)